MTVTATAGSAHTHQVRRDPVVWVGVGAGIVALLLCAVVGLYLNSRRVTSERNAETQRSAFCGLLAGADPVTAEVARLRTAYHCVPADASRPGTPAVPVPPARTAAPPGRASPTPQGSPTRPASAPPVSRLPTGQATGNPGAPHTLGPTVPTTPPPEPPPVRVCVTLPVLGRVCLPA